jgi:putative membrane protein
MITKPSSNLARTLLAGFVIASVPFMSANAQAKKSGLDDPTIVAIFDAANTWDMETGALAANRAHSKAVRDFAQMLVRDHKAVRQQGRDLAKKLGVTPTAPKNFGMAKDHAQAMAKLRRTKRSNFDREFLKHEVAGADDARRFRSGDSEESFPDR